jgi:hypothetical protein
MDNTHRPFFFRGLEDINVFLTRKAGKAWIQSYTFETRNCNSTPGILDGGALPPFISYTFQLEDLTAVALTNLKSINARR